MQHECVGYGSVNCFPQVLAREKPKNIFLVRGKTSYRLSGAEERITFMLRDYNVASFIDFSSNAKIDDVEKGISLFRKEHCDFVISVGGGSALDIAKAIALLANHPEKAEHYVLKKAPLSTRTVPLVAIPTTAGTGSEATHFAAIYIGKQKYSLAHPSMTPDYAIVDPTLTFSLPPYVTACTGMDALAQAIESYWSIHSTAQSREYAREAISLSLEHLEHAVTKPTPEAREGMAKAAHLAGKAINISFTTACHAISYPITSYFNVPHGHAVALTLPQMAVYNAEVSGEDCLDARGAEYVKQALGNLCRLFRVSSPQGIKDRLEQLLDAIGLERALQKLGIHSEQELDFIIKNGFNPERVKNNPRRLTGSSLRTILEHIR